MSSLPDCIKLTLITDPRLSQAIEASLEEEELISNFERIYGVYRPRKPRNGIELMVDKAAGYTPDSEWNVFLSEFIQFVYRCVYLPLYGDGDSHDKS